MYYTKVIKTYVDKSLRPYSSPSTIKVSRYYKVQRMHSNSYRVIYLIKMSR